jgi:hypothetical protein
MKLNTTFWGILAFIGFTSCTVEPEKVAEQFTEQGLRKHIEVLSSDAFEGRAPATLGEEKTVNYLVENYKLIGLEPAFGNSYVQDVPVVGQKVDKQSSISFVQNRRSISKANYSTDFMVWPSDQSEQVTLENLELVFVGYGIQASEEDWDDFKGVDVKGKVIVVKNNDPALLPGKFGENRRLYYGRYDYKYEIANKLGAAGVLIIHTTETAGYPWQVVSNSWGSERFELKSEIKTQTRLNGWMTKELAELLFQAEGHSLEKALADAETDSFKAFTFKKVRMNANVKAQYRNLNIKNVGGLLKGGQNKTGEAVVFTAHHDHIGIGTPVRGDSIFNGAIDNASGLSALLNMASTFTSIKSFIKRDMLFLAVGGEEKGLLGSKYFAANPSISPQLISFDVNLDGLNVFGKTKDAVYVALGRTTIDSYLLKRAEQFNRSIKPDQYPEQGFFYRSDHFSLAKVGIPALYLGSGNEFIDKPVDYKDRVSTLMRERYHTVFDEMDETWDLTGAIADLQLLFVTVFDMANAPGRMEWNSGDEFEAYRKKK